MLPFFPLDASYSAFFALSSSSFFLMSQLYSVLVIYLITLYASSQLINVFVFYLIPLISHNNGTYLNIFDLSALNIIINYFIAPISKCPTLGIILNSSSPFVDQVKLIGNLALFFILNFSFFS